LRKNYLNIRITSQSVIIFLLLNLEAFFVEGHTRKLPVKLNCI